MPTLADTADAPNAPDELPATCNVLGWVVFGPGWHNEGLYTPQMNDRMPVNFRELKDSTVPRAKTEWGGSPNDPAGKIGHDPRQLVAQRLKTSMGFLSVGRVTRCDLVPGYDGYIEIDVRGVPTRAIGGEIAADRLCGGSVELLSEMADPKNPARTIEGPILTGVAFLGEEQPAVRNWPPALRERAKPKATFDDGSPVPANPDVPQEWKSAQTEVMRQLAAETGGEFSADRRTLRVGAREFTERVACFSNISELAMNDEQKLMAALGDPEKVKKCMAALADGAAAPPVATAVPSAGAMPAPAAPMSGDVYAQCAKFADDPKATPEQKLMAAMAAQFAADKKKFSEEVDELKKRTGAAEKFAEEAQKKDEEAKMAAFSAEVAAACKAIETRVAPHLIETVVRPAAMNILTAKTFAAETDRRKAFSDFFAGFAALPADPRLKPAAGPAVNTAALHGEAATVVADIARKGGVLDRLMPTGANRVRALTTPAAAN